ncbi:MAG TPA: ABC transporter permease [Cyclobacteriaceae bacterium]|nr:ABC transporter permease [Cyclobacteriaceae bacterium]
MLRNHLVVALRHLLRNGLYSGLNIFGLVAGILCFSLITLYITHELDYDTYHEKKNRIYRLALGRLAENTPGSCVSAGVMPGVLKEEYAGIENYARFRKLPSLVAFNDNSNFEENFFFTDSTVFDVFSFTMVDGNPNTALTDPYSIVLTESAAIKYFGKTENVLGQLLLVDDAMTFKVTGVMKDVPGNSHLSFDLLASAATLPMHPQEHVRTYQLTGWYSHYFHNYLLLDENADPAVVAENIKTAAKLHSNPEEYELYGTNMGLFLQPLTDIHLNPLFGEIEPQGDRSILAVLAVVAIIILLLACVNFTNINTTLSMLRRREIGMRKMLGARKIQLTLQFLGETAIVTLLSFAISITIAWIVLPSFNSFTGKDLSLRMIFTFPTFGILAGAMLLTAVIASFYPAIFVGRFAPVAILRGDVSKGKRKLGLRKSIIVLQFVVSIVLVAGSLIISSQVDHMLRYDLGLKTDRVLAVPTHGDPAINKRLHLFFDRANQLPQVEGSAVSELVPGETIFGIVARIDNKEETRNFPTMGIGFGYLDTYKMKLIAGRDFDPAQPLDSVLERVIVNETFAARHGWTPQEAIGKTYDAGGDGQNVGEIVGVVKDFNFTSLKAGVAPVVMGNFPYFYSVVSIRLNDNATLDASITELEKVWHSVYPTRPFDFRFADDSVQKQYQAEKKFGTLFSLFSTLAIFIGVLGLFGMVSLDLSFRTKEIGIRKVLGAGMNSLVNVLSKDFLRLVLVAVAVSLPLSWWLANKWLSGFAYKVESIWVLIIVPAVLIFVMTFVLIGLQTFKASLQNPADVLRCD